MRFKDFDFDAAILFSDILFPLDFLGMKLSFSSGPIFENNLSQQMLSEYNIEEFQNYIQFQNKSLFSCTNFKSDIVICNQLIG